MKGLVIGILLVLGIASWVGFIHALFWGDNWRWAVGFLALNLCVAAWINSAVREHRR